MGLTIGSVGKKAADRGLKLPAGAAVVALAGNPNVGKSTVFNGLTGMNQHTGNWPGKTVSCAQGRCTLGKREYVMVDIPGTYSLFAHSAEEEAARDFLCFGNPDAVAVVCDATCLERNLNLVLQTIEISKRVVVCVNLMDEAARRGIKINIPMLTQRLGVPVVGMVARKRKNLVSLVDALDGVISEDSEREPYTVVYSACIESACAPLQSVLERRYAGRINSRWLALRLLEGEEKLTAEASEYLGEELTQCKEVSEALAGAQAQLEAFGIDSKKLRDITASTLVRASEEICSGAVLFEQTRYNEKDIRIDKILTGKLTGYPVMLALLAVIFWLTITGANYPSQLLGQALFWVQDRLTELFTYLGAPGWLHGLLVLGMYRVVAWVVSVMLPPMAIFFPLFTLLEDAGYLPRVAFNLDKPFQRCRACGKQALTMCMGFGCNAAGIVGCRIIDSPRERLLAMLTNSFVPCNGRFPTLIALLTMFFVGTAQGFATSVLSALLLTAVILLGIAVTFASTKLLSKTVLKGVPSSFTLELPAYRQPQIGRVIVRSVLDRTLFVLGRAVAVAAPAGIIIWLTANVTVGGASLLSHAASFLDPFAQLMGMDGIILIAFILGFPANEIVVPIIIMAYMSGGSLCEAGSFAEMKTLFVDNGWTWCTAISVMLFSLMHWPCSTTLLTVKKESGSVKWTLLAAALPTAAGIASCMAFNFAVRLFGG